MRVPFPTLGLHEGLPVTEQPILTSFLLQNVRAYDTGDERRGGQRAGTVLAYDTRIVGDFPVIKMVSIVTTYIIPG